MKNKLIILSAITVLLTACGQPDQNHHATEHATMNHGDKKQKNVMLQAMDQSMLAMHKNKMTGNADYDFASMMIPHHEGAVAMAEAVVKSGKSPELIAFSQKVIAAQNQEIAALKSFLTTSNLKPTANAAKFKAALNASMVPMMEGMQTVNLTNNIDKDFVTLMIPHHQSAVDMAKAYLPYATNQQIKKIAEQILTAQQAEIKWLKKQ